MASPVINKQITLDFSSMTIDELRAESQRQALVLGLVNSQRAEIFNMITRRLAEANTRVKLSTMGAIEKDALRTVLQE